MMEKKSIIKWGAYIVIAGIIYYLIYLWYKSYKSKSTNPNASGSGSSMYAKGGMVCWDHADGSPKQVPCEENTEKSESTLQRHFPKQLPIKDEALVLKCVPPWTNTIVNNEIKLVCSKDSWAGGWIPNGYYASYYSASPNETNPTECCYSLHKINPHPKNP